MLTHRVVFWLCAEVERSSTRSESSSLALLALCGCGVGGGVYGGLRHWTVSSNGRSESRLDADSRKRIGRDASANGVADRPRVRRDAVFASLVTNAGIGIAGVRRDLAAASAGFARCCRRNSTKLVASPGGRSRSQRSVRKSVAALEVSDRAPRLPSGRKLSDYFGTEGRS